MMWICTSGPTLMGSRKRFAMFRVTPRRSRSPASHTPIAPLVPYPFCHFAYFALFGRFCMHFNPNRQPGTAQYQRAIIPTTCHLHSFVFLAVVSCGIPVVRNTPCFCLPTMRISLTGRRYWLSYHAMYSCSLAVSIGSRTQLGASI